MIAVTNRVLITIADVIVCSRTIANIADVVVCSCTIANVIVCSRTLCFIICLTYSILLIILSCWLAWSLFVLQIVAAMFRLTWY